MYNDVITLVKEVKTINGYGDRVSTRTEREVFAELKSIGQSEFYQAQATGLKPEIKFILSDFLDYQGERIVKYTPFGTEEEEEYTVLRTYRSDTQLELTCVRGVD